MKNEEDEVEKFISANTQELGKDKWLCPLSGDFNAVVNIDKFYMLIVGNQFIALRKVLSDETFFSSILNSDEN